MTIIILADSPAPNPRDYTRLFVAEMEPSRRPPWDRTGPRIHFGNGERQIDGTYEGTCVASVLRVAR